MSPRSVLPCTRSSPARNNSLNAFRAEELAPSPFSYAAKPRGARGFTPSRALPWGRRSRPSAVMRRRACLRFFDCRVSLPRRRGCERVPAFSRSPKESRVAAEPHRHSLDSSVRQIIPPCRMLAFHSPRSPASMKWFFTVNRSLCYNLYNSVYSLDCGKNAYSGGKHVEI